MQKTNIFQKIADLLNTSSETFMLIALVSLFVLPIVMAKNLEPVVKSAYQPSVVPNVQSVANNETVSPESISEGQSNNVLGVSTLKTLKELIIEDTANLSFFDKHSSTLTDSNYNLSIETFKRFGKIPVFIIINTSTSTQSFELNVRVVGDLKVKTNQQKTIYIDNTPYSLDDASALPISLLVSPGQEVIISLMSNRTSPTLMNISLSRNN